MTYKLNPALSKIQSPLILLIDGEEAEYRNGKALTEQEFEKNYLVGGITAKDNRIVISLTENPNVIPNADSWNHGYDSLSFFERIYGYKRKQARLGTLADYGRMSDDMRRFFRVPCIFFGAVAAL